jgi:predicted branched-subunit amino acid permease
MVEAPGEMDDDHWRARTAWRRGAHAAMPLVPGAVLFGLATGAATVSAGMVPAAAFAMPAAFYAGVAQLAYVQLAVVGTPFAPILLTVALTHLRYLIYATIVSTWPRPGGFFFRVVAPYLISESAFALALHEPAPSRLRFMVGAGLPLWWAWIGAGIAGTFLAGLLPPLKHAYAVPAIVMAPVLARQVSGRARVAAALGAVVLGLLLSPLPLRLGPLLAALLAVTAVLAAMRLSRRPR